MKTRPNFANTFTEVTTSGDFETEIDKLLRRLRNNSLTITTESEQSLSDVTPTKPTDFNYSNILVDNGNGRIDAGLKSLELLSILRSGTLVQNLFLFDNIIYHGSPLDFDTTNNEELINLVIINVGMATVIGGLPEETTAQFKDVALDIATLVKNGKYSSDMFANFMRKEARKLVKIYVKA